MGPSHLASGFSKETLGPLLFYSSTFVVNITSCIVAFKCANEYFPIRVNNSECSLNLAFIEQLKTNFC